MNKSTIAICLALSTACTSILTGCAEPKSDKPTSPTSTPGASNQAAADKSEGLKLGTLLSATGDVASIAAPLPEAVKLAVAKANKCGGVNGKPVTVVSEDDQSKSEIATAAMTKLATVDQVAGVVGSFASSVSKVAAEIGGKNKVMLVSPGSTSPDLTKKAEAGDFKGYWARTAPSDVHQAPALAKLAWDRKLKTVAVIAAKNDYGIAFEREFVAAFKKLGGTITNESTPIHYDPKGATFETEVKTAMAGKPQGLAAIVYPDESGPLVLKAAYEQGLLKGVQILMPDAGYSDSFPKSVAKTKEGKSILEGAIGTVPGAKGTAYKDFEAAWKATNKPFSPYLAQSWDAANLLMLAAEAAKANTGEGIMSKIREVSGGEGSGKPVSDVCEGLKLLKAGEKINYEGASGAVDMDKSGDVLGSYDIWQIQPDNTYKVINNVVIPGAKDAGKPASAKPEASTKPKEVEKNKPDAAKPKEAEKTPAKTN
jgi:neutral amino acid transport system substrate-binding protein